MIQNNMIPRKALMEQMEQGTAHRFLYLCAPAGYGKTIAAKIWMHRSSGSHALITVDEYDNSKANFCRRVIMALSKCQPDNEQIRQLANNSQFDNAPDMFVRRGVDLLNTEEEIRLLIDDIHWISDGQVLRFLPAFLNCLPENVKTVITSRHEPPECLSEFVIKDSLCVLNIHDLRFSIDEIFQLFKTRKHAITRRRAEEIYEITEGWPIGINAVILSGTGRFEDRLAKNHLSAFIRAQIWEHWDEEIRDFMMKVSVVDEMVPELCIALTSNDNSGKILENLVTENAFITENSDGFYRFHHLFKAFLREQLAAQGEDIVHELKLKAGEWYLSQKDFYKAAEFISEVNDADSVAKCFDFLEEIDHDSFVLDRVFPVIRRTIKEEYADKYPFLLYMMAYAAFDEGRGADMEKYMDRYYKEHPKIAARNPEVAHNIFFLYCLDYRIPWHKLMEMMKAIDVHPEFKAAIGSVTQNMPLFHRGPRDFSEYAGPNMEDELYDMLQTVRGLIGEGIDVLVECMIGGIYYEQGDLNKAYKFAVSANIKLQDEHHAEVKFSARMLLSHVFCAMHRFDEADDILKKASDEIEDGNAYYLCSNLDAVTARKRMEGGNRHAAESWLVASGADPFMPVMIYKLYQHYTMARAFIINGEDDKAAVLLTKLIEMCETYRRPLDIIEGKILLSIVYWKKRKGFQIEALSMLEEAIVLAHEYGYRQMFENEGASLVTMLSKLKNRANRQDYEGKLPGPFTKELYLRALEQSQYSKGIASVGQDKNTTFTEKQMKVMRLMTEGKSYKQIADEMGIKFSTVRSHIELIYRKLDVAGETEAVLKIREKGILDEYHD